MKSHSAEQAWLEQADPQGFLSCVEGLGEQFEQGWTLGIEPGPLPDSAGIDSVLTLGMGGSGIAGHFLKAVLGASFNRVFEVCKGYELPGWVGSNTLVLAVSYSGRTEEVLHTAQQAAERSALMVVVSAGGTLLDRARNLGWPCVQIPDGLQPRAALGYLVGALLGISQRLGLDEFGGQVGETVDLLKRRRGEWGRDEPEESNPAKQLARAMSGHLPVVYGAEGLAGVAAYRWKCQLNENSKVAAYSQTFPELAHNEIVGWTEPSGGTGCKAAFVILRHPHEDALTARKIDVTCRLLEASSGLLTQVSAEGESLLANLMDLSYFGDFVAIYLAFYRGVDPIRIDAIDHVKRLLAAGAD
jgi:glucose/mannose-6-phosphate isomerase